MLNLLKRIFKSGWSSFWRNKWLSVAAIIMMSLTIFVIISLLMVSVMTNSLVTTLQDKIDISVYFETETEEEEILRTRAALAGLAEVERVEYVSKEEALDRFKERHKDNSVLMQSINELSGNPLGAALNIKAQVASQYETIVYFLSQPRYESIIDNINYQENQVVISKLSNITDSIQRSGFLVSVILGVMAILVAFNTIRLTMYSAREEINVMKLVGASHWFIRGPFMVEGALYGLVAGLFSFLVFYPILWYISPKITSFLPGTDLLYFYQANFWGLLALQVGIGIVLGIFSSLVAIRRYLREQ